VTRHSNLSEVHVIFHLVTDPSLSVSDIPARNPVMVGLRNCLHAASHHDIHTITIPLLMVNDMSPVSVTCVLISTYCLIAGTYYGHVFDCLSKLYPVPVHK